MTQAKPLPVYTVVQSGADYAVHRDGVAMITPNGNSFGVPTLALAEAIAGEWRAQGEKIKPSTMPMTQLAATAIDIVRNDRAAIITQVANYAAVDLLCVRAEAPEELVIRQHREWQPILDWCAEHFGASLKTGQGIKAPSQLPGALDAIRRAVEKLDDFMLTGVRHAAELSSSLVLALALAERHVTAEQVFHAAELEALFQAEKWGDDLASAKRHESIRADLISCEKWFELCDCSVK